MTDIEELIQVVQETLDGQRVIRLGDSCLVGNAAAEQLETFGTVVLPAIQQVILQQVVPASLEVADHHELMRRFTGLLSLWVVYFRVAQSTHLQETLAFLGTLEGSVLASAVLGMPSVWKYADRHELPPALATFLHEVARHPSDPAADVARQQISYVWGQPG